MDGSGHFFDGLRAALGAGIEPLVISYPPEQALDYCDLTDFVRSRLPNDRPFFLLGESFSGPVAIALAAERPAMLAGLILSCTFARNPAPPLRALRPLVRFAPLSHRFAALAEPLLLGWRAPAELRRTLRAVLATVPPAVLRMRLREVLGVNYSAQAGRIAVPVLYLQAAQDRVVSARSARQLHTLLPAMRTVALPGPHLLLQAAPGPAATAISCFIDEHLPR